MIALSLPLTKIILFYLNEISQVLFSCLRLINKAFFSNISITDIKKEMQYHWYLHFFVLFFSKILLEFRLEFGIHHHTFLIVILVLFYLLLLFGNLYHENFNCVTDFLIRSIWTLTYIANLFIFWRLYSYRLHMCPICFNTWSCCNILYWYFYYYCWLF